MNRIFVWIIAATIGLMPVASSFAQIQGGGASALSQLNDVAVTGSNAPSNGQTLSYDSSTTKWKPGSAVSGGTVTSVTCGTGLSGGTITTTGTCAFGTIADQTILGNVAGSSAVPIALTPTQLTTLVNPFSSSLSGAAPASGGGTANFLRADGTWAAPTGITIPTADLVGGNGSTLTSVTVGSNLTLSGGTLSGFALTPQGAWSATTPYAVGSVVTSFGGVYEAYSATTAGATWDTTFAPVGSGFAYTNSNYTVSVPSNSAGTPKTARASTSVTSGKIYVEFSVDAAVTVQDFVYGLVNGSLANTTKIGATTNGFGLEANNPQNWILNSVTTASGMPNPSSGNKIALAVDLTAGKAWVANATSAPTTWYGNNGTGSPAAGTNAFTFTPFGVPLFAAFTSNQNGSAQTSTINVGGTAFTGTIPTGFSAYSLQYPAADTSHWLLTGGQLPTTNGQLLIGGNSSGTGSTLATLSAGSGIAITNAAGSITIATVGGGGSTTLISTQTATAGSPVAALSWGSLATYTQYQMVCYAIMPNTDNTDIYLRYGEGGTFKITNYKFAFQYVAASPNSTGSAGGSNSTGVALNTGARNTAGNPGMSINAIITNMTSTTLQKTTIFDVFAEDASANDYRISGSGKYYADTGAITDIEVIANSGTISGTCSLYGLSS